MDETDLKLIQMLSNGSNINFIAKKLNISRQSVYYRVQRLKKKINLRETISADFNKMGINTTILVMVKWKLGKSDELSEFVPKLIEDPHIALAFPLLGRWDYCLIITAKSMKDYREFITWIHKTGGECLDSWESFPITDFRKGGIEIPDVQKILSEDKESD